MVKGCCNTDVKKAQMHRQTQVGSTKPRLKSVAIKVRKINLLNRDKKGNVLGLVTWFVPVKPRSKRVKTRICREFQFLKNLSSVERHKVLEKVKKSRDYSFLLSDSN